MNKYDIMKALSCCASLSTYCIDCPYYNNGDFNCDDGKMNLDALELITGQEREIEQLTRECKQQAETLAEEQEACAECELEQSWELFVRDKEIDRLRAENERFENNMKSVLEIEKKNVVKEFAEKVKEKAYTNNYCQEVVLKDTIDELLKEYEE